MTSRWILKRENFGTRRTNKNIYIRIGSCSTIWYQRYYISGSNTGQTASQLFKVSCLFFWHVPQRGLVVSYRRFGQSICPIFKGHAVQQALFSD